MAENSDETLKLSESKTERKNPKWIEDLGQTLESIDWNKLKFEVSREGFPEMCDVVGMRVARKLRDQGLEIEPVSAVLHGETDAVTKDQAHTLFIIKNQKEKYLLDLTYAFYVPSYYMYRVGVTINRPYLILPFKDEIPKVNDQQLYRVLYYQFEGEERLLLGVGMENGEVDLLEEDSLEQAIINSARRYYEEAVERNNGIDMYGGLNGYLKTMMGIEIDDCVNAITPQQKDLMAIAVQKMKEFLETGKVDEEEYQRRWAGRLNSKELTRLLDKLERVTVKSGL